MARQSLIPFGFAAREPILSLHREMNRLFDDVFREDPGSQLAGRASSTGLPTLINARMNVSETDKDIRVTVELPGVTEQDIDVSLEDDTLTIRGEKREERAEGERENFHYIERSYGSFQRSLRLPFSAQPDQVRASFQNGVLTVTVPKNERESRTHKIQVQGSSIQGGERREQVTARKDVAGEGGKESGKETSRGGSPSAKH